MSRNLLLVLFAIPTLLHGSAAQTRHVVGDAMGWIIPPGGATTYTTWASNKTFTKIKLKIESGDTVYAQKEKSEIIGIRIYRKD
ncbi:hypothetical protein JHK84_055051 [Glycine max]|nr:hypothetical protein JHK86_055030 [Glycine max]KAG5073820.1 hypothetical protein JHK84_055051 [Glycine max]